MNRSTRAWVLLGAVSCSWACGDDAGPAPAAGGQANQGSSGSATAAGTGGSASSAGASGSAATVAGTAGQSSSGAPSGGMGGSASGGMGGSASGGMGGGGGGAGGSGGSGGAASTLPKRVLLYHFSTLAIDTVPAQITALKNQLMTWGYEVVDSVKPEDISTANLATFGGVGMINTCFEPFGAGKMGAAETAALTAFVEGGGGLFGTHCASVTFQSANPPHAYNVLLGGRAGSQNFTGKSTCTPTAEAHVSTAMLPATFEFNGNLDNADYVAPDTKVLVKCKWSDTSMRETAVSWSRTQGKGRVFFTNFAKTAPDLSDATLGQKHIMLGLGWTLGR